MKSKSVSPPSTNYSTPDVATQFVVVDSSTCRVPAVLKLSSPPVNTGQNEKNFKINYDDMNENDRNDQYQTSEKVVNMRIDIKRRLHNPTGFIAPPSTPSPISSQSRESGATASRGPHPPAEMCTVSNIWNEEAHYTDYDLIDAYAAFTRSNKEILRNRSAPPIISQYRSRLSKTSQWIKKRAVVESKAGKPKTSVRPFSERKSNDEIKLHLATICIEPPSSRTPIPDLGYFRGKPPISPTTRSASKLRLKNSTMQRDNTVEYTEERTTKSQRVSRNKKEWYVSELGKSIKTRNSRVRSTKHNSPKLQENVCVTTNTKEYFLRDLGTNKSKRLDSSTTKGSRPHTVTQKVISELSNQPENPKKQHIIEVKGDYPPAISTTAQITNETNTDTAVNYQAIAQSFPMENIAFRRPKTTLHKQNQRATTHYTNRMMNQENPVKYLLDNLNVYHMKKTKASSSIDRRGKENLLPYLKFHQSVGDFKTSDLFHNPFGRTLI